MAARRAGGLRDLGVGPGDRVAIISDNRAEWAVGAYATYTLGASWVPMYEAQTQKDWVFILEDSGAKVFFGSEMFADTCRAAREELAEPILASQRKRLEREAEGELSA